MLDAVHNWGSIAAERDQSLPCDELVPNPSDVVHRAVDVDAPVAVTFRWLCQLQAAPYSYDKLDNFGRRSPQELTPGLERLEPGTKWMTIFRLASFQPGHSITLLHEGKVFGRLGVTYAALPAGDASRILVRMLVERPTSLSGRLLGPLLAPGDLVMMRRQLLNLKGLAEANQPVLR